MSGAGVLDLLDPYCEGIEETKNVCLGQLAWAVVPNIETTPQVIEGERSSNPSHSTARARWVPMGDQHFKRRVRAGLPILQFALGETEELVAYKAKLRPAIIVGTRGASLGGLEKKTPLHHDERRVAVAPIYDLRTEDDPKGFGSILATRVRYLLYPQFFPFGGWTETRSSVLSRTSFREGVVRFDRIQFLLVGQAGLHLAPVKLAKDALALMHHSLWSYLHADEHEFLKEMRGLVRESLPDEAKPPGWS